MRVKSTDRILRKTVLENGMVSEDRLDAAIREANRRKTPLLTLLLEGGDLDYDQGRFLRKYIKRYARTCKNCSKVTYISIEEAGPEQCEHCRGPLMSASEVNRPRTTRRERPAGGPPPGPPRRERPGTRRPPPPGPPNEQPAPAAAPGPPATARRRPAPLGTGGFSRNRAAAGGPPGPGGPGPRPGTASYDPSHIPADSPLAKKPRRAGTGGFETPGEKMGVRFGPPTDGPGVTHQVHEANVGLAATVANMGLSNQVAMIKGVLVVAAVIVLFSAVSAVNAVFSAGEIVWHKQNWKGRQAASQAKKPLVCFISNPVEPKCSEFQKEVLESWTVTALADDFVWLFQNTRKGGEFFTDRTDDYTRLATMGPITPGAPIPHLLIYDQGGTLLGGTLTPEKMDDDELKAFLEKFLPK